MAVLMLVASWCSQAEEAPTLDLQLRLARSGQFYLELDAARRSLRLQLAGVELRRYPVLAVEAGAPRIAFVPLGEPMAFRGTAWSAGRLQPPRRQARLEILPAPAGSDSTPLQLPPRFDALPVPWTYRLHFSQGLTVIVTSRRDGAPRHPASLGGILRDKLVETTQALFRRRPVLRLTLARADAQHLYRSLPPEPSLLVLGP